MKNIRNYSSTALASKGSSSGRTHGPLFRKLGKDNKRQMSTFCRKLRLQDSFQQKTSPFSQSSILLTVNKSCLRRRGLETPSKEGSEENDSGGPGVLFKDILYSWKEWEIKVNHLEPEGSLSLCLDTWPIPSHINILGNKSHFFSSEDIRKYWAIDQSW